MSEDNINSISDKIKSDETGQHRTLDPPIPICRIQKNSHSRLHLNDLQIQFSDLSTSKINLFDHRYRKGASAVPGL